MAGNPTVRNDNKATHFLRLLRSGDTWGSYWLSNEGRSNEAAKTTLTNSLREDDKPVFFATKSVNSITLPGSNGADYTPAEGLCIGIYTNSTNTVLVEVWDEDGNTAPLALIRSTGVKPVRIRGVRTALNTSGQYVGLYFADEGYKAPNI